MALYKPKQSTVEPQHVSDTCWTYAERHGLVVVQEERTADGGLVCATQTTLPWKHVEAALAARPKKK